MKSMRRSIWLGGGGVISGESSSEHMGLNW